MRTECISAVEQAAAAFGRKLTKADITGIETKMREARQQLATRDAAAFIGMTEAEKLTESAKILAAKIAHDAKIKKMRAEKQIVADASYYQYMQKASARGMSPYEAIKHYAFTVRDEQGGIGSIESLSNARARKWMSEMVDLWDMVHPGILNLFTDKKMEADFWREMFGTATGNDVAAKAAKSAAKVLEKVRRELNDAGFDIPKLANYRSPQALSFYRVWKAAKTPEGMKNVIDDFMQAVDRNAYVDEQTGQLMDDAQMREFLREAITTIATDGANKKPGEGSGTASLANRHKAHRQLHYKDAESFISIMDKYSESNAIDMISGFLDSAARDIEMVKKFGPNALHSMNSKVADLQKINLGDTNKMEALRQAIEEFAGVRQAIKHQGLHRFGQNMRAAMSSVLLGSNTITQLSDQATLAATARAMRIPVIDAYLNQAKYISSGKYRSTLRSAAIGFDTAANTLARFGDSAQGSLFGKLAAAQMTINGSNFMTNAVRAAFGDTMMNHVGDMTRRLTWSSLEPEDRARFEGKGVTEAMWNIWREAGLDTTDGATRLTADGIYAVPLEKIDSNPIAAAAARDNAAMTFLASVLDETHMASVQPGFLSKFDTIQRGTLGGELAMLALQFKSFPWAYFRMHMMERPRANGGGIMSRAAYLLPLITGTTMMGGIALLLNDMASGRDPREAWNDDDPTKAMKFGFQAFVKGGGAGILGDLANLDPTRNVQQQLTGPGMNWMSQALGASASSAMLALQAAPAIVGGEPREDYEEWRRKAGRDVMQLTKSSIPFGNLWWGKNVLHNLMLKDFYEFMNPGYMDRMRGAAEKNYSAGVWTEEGRAPNISNVYGGSPQ